MRPSKATSELFASGAHFCPVGLFVFNNTVTQLEIHSCHLQVLNSVPSVVVSSPWAQKLWFWDILEYLHETHLPPQPFPLQYAECLGCERFKVLPPWEGLHEPMVCKPEQLFSEPCPFSYRIRSCWTLNPPHKKAWALAEEGAGPPKSTQKIRCPFLGTASNTPQRI